MKSSSSSLHKRDVLTSTSSSTSSTPIISSSTVDAATAANEQDMSSKYYDPVNKSSTSIHQIENNSAIATAYDMPNTTYKARLASFWHNHTDYLIGLATRIGSLVVILGVLIALGIGLRYTDGVPKAEDFSHLSFDWPKINPSSYLQPFNTSFQQYNVLLDGHSHSTYSDGKMNVRQLLDWHIGRQRKKERKKKRY
jgi:hypothetical protein